MTPERWQQIDRLFHSVLEMPLSDRADFLQHACGDDEFLRSEVESLIESHERSDGFITAPPGDIAAEFLGNAQRRLRPGQLVGHYIITALLATGGMGEVYLARDEKLGRKIALKLLPAEFTNHPERVRRFELEARAASALNHPNILTIYEIGQSESSHFIATEFVEGQTLRQHISAVTAGSTIDVTRVLDIAIQIASALAAAHSAGIVHRDVKPENIMLRSDGLVKVLDFGLAKLAQEQHTDVINEKSTLSMVSTNPGVVMGTLRYMSPEQARGLEVDARSDIWSLGVVLYETITGTVPFQGRTPKQVILSLLQDEPAPLRDSVQIPSELARIVSKTLRKDRHRRYHHATELVLDLKNLKQQLESQGSLRPLQRLQFTSSIRQLTSDPNDSAASTVQLDIPGFSATRDHPSFSFKKAVAVVLPLLLIASGFGIYKLANRNQSSASPPTPFQAIELLRLTNSGRVYDSAISPDGKYVAYVVEKDGKQSIWLRQIVNSNNIQVVPPDDIQFYGVTFSEAGDFLYYIAKERNNSIGTLYRVPALGGAPVKLIADVDGPITLSPDEKQMAFVRGSSTGERALMIADADGSNERKLASRMGYGAFSFGGPAWSPNGKGILSAAAYTENNGRFMTVVEVDVSNGSIRPLTSHRWKGIGRISWLQDSQGIVFTAAELGSGTNSQLWYMDHKSGEAYRISKDLQDYDGASLTSDAKTLVTNQTQTLSSLWVAPNDDANRATEIISQKKDNAYNYSYRTRFSWVPDGRIIYTSLVNDMLSLWEMSGAGENHRQLTRDTSNSTFPSVTSDSRYIVFVSEGTGFPNIWRMDLDGGNLKKLSMGQDESWAWCSPDSQWVVYHSSNQGKRTVWKVPIEGGTPEQLTDYPSVCPVVSPDGQWIVVYYRLETKAPWRLGIVPFNGGHPVRSFEVPKGVLFQSLVRWTPDGSALAYILNKDGVSNIWVQPLDGRPAKQLTNFKTDQMFWFEWSPDGQQLGVSRGAITSDVVMIRR